MLLFPDTAPIRDDQQLSEISGDLKKQIRHETSEIAENFLMSDQAKELGTWFEVRNGWILTYFLDAQEQASERRANKKLWYEFEKELNDNVRLPLRKKLKEKDTFKSIRLPIVFMRACKYTKTGSDVQDMDVDD